MTKTKRLIEYVSQDMVRGELGDFMEKILPERERAVAEKYKSIMSSCMVHEIAATVCAKLTVALYLTCATYKDAPSYRQQLTILYDFRQLLDGERNPKYFTSRKKYYLQYVNICAMLDEYQSYQKTSEVSGKFFRLIGVEQENISTEHTIECLAYSREMTLVMIDEVTKLVREQIYRIFPVKALRFVQEILNENTHDTAIEMGGEETLERAKKVTFSL